MAPEEDPKKRVGRKLTKKRKEGHQVTMVIPERFRDGDDADEDCTAVPRGRKALNQSVFGMITAASGSQVDFNSRFPVDMSSDEEDEEGSGEPSSQSSELQVNKTRGDKAAAKGDKHRRNFSSSKLLRSFPSLAPKKKSKSSSKESSGPPSPHTGSSTEPTAPEIELPQDIRRDAPVMERMLEAKAEMSLRPSFDMPRPGGDNAGKNPLGNDSSQDLAKRLMEIFQFESAEDVLEGLSPEYT
jgi:sterol 3beta-glucosyltransferase